MANGNLNKTDKTQLKEDILVDVLHWFVAACPRSMPKPTRREFQKLFNESVWAAIDNNTIKSYDAGHERYLRGQMRSLAALVCSQTSPTGTISKGTLRDVFSQFVGDYRAMLAKGRGGTVFCDAYTV